MESKNFIKFLGTAGARYVVARQLRYSGGTFINFKNTRIILDPGPGTLVRCAKTKPPIDIMKLDAIILTHLHIDHSNDVNILIDGLTEGGKKRRGVLFAPEECISGENAVVLKYLHNFLKRMVILKPEQRYSIGELEFSTSIKHKHGVETYGIKFHLPDKTVSFMVDTLFFPELIENYKDSDILIMNVVRYKADNKKQILHLSFDDVKKIVNIIRPKKTILTHFGMTMLRAKPWELCKNLSRETGLEIIAASDGMTVEI